MQNPVDLKLKVVGKQKWTVRLVSLVPGLSQAPLLYFSSIFTSGGSLGARLATKIQSLNFFLHCSFFFVPTCTGFLIAHFDLVYFLAA